MMLRRLWRSTLLLLLLRLGRCHRRSLRRRLQLIVRRFLLHLGLLERLRCESRWHRLSSVVLHHDLRHGRMLRMLRMLVCILWGVCRLRWGTLHLRLRGSLRMVEGLVRCVGICRLRRRSSLGMLRMSLRHEIGACPAEMLLRVLLLWVLHSVLRSPR